MGRIADAEARDHMKLMLRDTMKYVIEMTQPFEYAESPQGAAVCLVTGADYTEKTTRRKLYTRLILLVGESPEALDEAAQRASTVRPG